MDGIGAEIRAGHKLDLLADHKCRIESETEVTDDAVFGCLGVCAFVLLNEVKGA